MGATVTTAAVESVPIDAVKVGIRRRKKVAKIAGLCRSIQDHGLIHPILVRNGNELVTGLRRLTACKKLGWETIPVRRVDELSDDELRALELQENIQRADLNDFETGKQRLAELKQAEAKARGEVSSHVGTKPKPKSRGGRPREPGSKRATAEASDVPLTTVDRIEKHIALAEKHPFMQREGWVQSNVIKAGKALDSLPEDEHEGLAVLLDQPAIPPKRAIGMLRNMADMEPEQRGQIYEMARDVDPHVRSRALTDAAKLPPAPDPGLLRLDEAKEVLQRAAKECRVSGFRERIGNIVSDVEAIITDLRQETANGKS